MTGNGERSGAQHSYAGVLVIPGPWEGCENKVGLLKHCSYVSVLPPTGSRGFL